MDVTPEKVLMWSVLERAILDALGWGVQPHTNAITLKRDAAKWIRSEEEEVYSFEWICHHLNICPIRVRNFIRTNQGKYWISTRGITIARYFDDPADWPKNALRL